MDLTFASLSRSQGATINFKGTSLGQVGNYPRILFTSPLTPASNGSLGAWAIFNSTDYAAYNAGQGVGAVNSGGFAAYSTTFGSGNITNLQATAAMVTTLPSGISTTSLLRLAGGFTQTLNFTNAGDILNLQQGGILRDANAQITTIGSVGTRGVITSGVTELVVFNNSNLTATAMTINSVIDGAGTKLIKSGAGVLSLTAVNTYTGGTTVNEGTLELRGTTAGDVVIPAGGLTLTNGTVTMFTNAGQIAASTNVTLNANSTLTLVGANSLASITFNNNGGNGNPTVTSGGLLTLTGATPISVSSSNLGRIPTIAGSISLGTSGTKTIDVPAVLLDSVVLSTLQPTLAITADILSPGIAVTKTGNGVLKLSGNSTFTGGFNLNAGAVMLSASTSPTQGGAGLTTGPMGSGQVAVASGARLIVDASRSIGNNINFAGTPLFDSDNAGAWTLTLNGTLNGVGLSSSTPTINIANPSMTVALLGNISNIANITSFTRTGLGRLIFNSTGYTGNFDATALGFSTAVSLLNDGNGTGAVETINLVGGVIFESGVVPAITVGRAGGSLPSNQAANKYISPASISNLGLGLTVTNSNGYGLKSVDNVTVTAGANYNVGTVTDSSLTQGLELAGVITASSGFTKSGAGTLVLSSASNSISTITVSQGVVSIGSLAALGGATVALNPTTGISALRITETITGSPTIQLSNTTLVRTIEVVNGKTFTLSAAFDLNGGAGTTASLAKNENGTLVLNASNSSWSGSLNINQGAVLINNNTLTSPAGTGTIFISPAAANIGAALQLAGGVTVGNAINLQNTTNILNNGINFQGAIDNVSGTNTLNGTIAHPWDSAIGARSSSTLNISGGIVSTGTHALQFNAVGNINFSGGQTGPAHSIRKFGAGTLTISAPWAGTLTTYDYVIGGTLVLSGTATLPLTPNSVFGGATLRLDNSATSTNTRLTGGALTVRGGTFNFVTNSTTELAGVLTTDIGASTLSMTGTGTASLTFASMTNNAGSSLNITGSAGALGTSTNFIKFTTPPTLVPASTGILSRVTVNGSEFATYSTGNGLIAFTGYAAATNVLSATATQTFKATTATSNSLTGNQTLNALTLSSGPLVGNSPTMGGLSGLNPTTLTLTTGAILATGTSSGATSSLSIPVISFGATGTSEAIIHVATGQTLSVTSGFSTTGGLSKNLGGTLNFNAQQFVSGTTYVNAGTLSLNQGFGSVNTLLFNNAVSVNVGGTLDLAGSHQFMAGLSSDSALTTSGNLGGTVTNSDASHQSTLVINGNTNFGGVIAGNIFLNKTGTGALNLQAQQTYTGESYFNGGTVTLSDYGALPNTASAITLNYTTLSVVNTSLYQVDNRVNDTAPITMVGGYISVGGRPQAVVTETMGAVTLGGGHNAITTSAGTINVNSLDVTFASLARTNSAATIRFAAYGQMGSSTGRVLFTTAPTLTNGIIGPWAIVDREYASYDATYGIGVLNGVGFVGYAGSGLNTSPANTDNVRFTVAGTTTLNDHTTVGTLTFGSQATATILDLNTKTLTLKSGGLLISQGTDSINFSINNGFITSGVLDSASDLFLIHANFGGTARTASINAIIKNNGTGALRLILSSGQVEAAGVGNTTLEGINTYTGGTVLNAGNYVIGATGALGTGGITVSGGSLTQTAGGAIPSQALTMMGNSLVTLAGNNSLTGITFTNNGGSAPTVTPTGTLTLTGGITATTSNAGTISTIGTGNLDLNGAAAFAISVGATLVNGVNVAPWQAGLDISSVIQNGGITKTGAGLLKLSGASTFTGGVTISAGGLVLGASSSGNLLNDTVTSGPLGTGMLTLAANTTMAATVASTVANNVTFQGDFTFNGTSNITLNGTTTLPAAWNVAITAPQMTVIIGDASGSTDTDTILKSGLGILTVGSYNGTISAAGGLVYSGDGNLLGTPEADSLLGNTVLTGDLSLTVNRSGSGPNARNKTLQKVNLTNPGSILSVSNQSGYGIQFTGTTTLNGASHFAVGVATASNVVQGLTLSGIVSDSGGYTLTKSGAGTLALTNSGNTFGGAGATIDVLSGVLAASSDGALGNAANTVTLNVDGLTSVGFRATGTIGTARTFILNQANNAIEVVAGSTLTLNSAFTLGAAGNNLGKNDNGTLVINANNTGWAGTVTLTAGILRATNANAFGTSVLTDSGNGWFAYELANNITLSNAMTHAISGNGGLNSTGVIRSLSGNNTYAGLITATTSLTVGAEAGATLNLTGGIASTNSMVFYAASGGTVNLNSVYGLAGGVAAAGGAINKTGLGTLNVTVNHTAITGAINVNQGTLNVSGSGVTLGLTGLITVNASGTLSVDDSTGAASTHLGGRALTLQGGSFTYAGNASNSAETFGILSFARAGGVFTTNASGAANSVLTFASLSFAADATANFVGTNLGTATNKILFSTPPTLVPATTGLLARATVNGADFATYGANGIAAFSTYNATSATNINSAGATDTVNASTSMATLALTASKTINALKLSGSSAVTVSGAAFNQLTLTSGGLLATGATTHILSVPVVALGAVQGAFHVDTGSTLNLSSTLTGTAGFVKDGAGTLIISSAALTSIAGISQNSLTGNFTLARGTVKLAGGNNTVSPTSYLVMGGPSATLDLNATSQMFTGGVMTDFHVAGSGGTITNTDANSFAQLVDNHPATDRYWSGVISAKVNFVRSGAIANNLIVTSDNTYTGSTLINGGSVTLVSEGALSGTTSIAVNYGGSLILDNDGFSGAAAPGSSGADKTNRINDAAAISLSGGTLSFKARQGVASTETVGAVTLTQGTSTISAILPTVAGVNSGDFTLTSLTRSTGGGTVNFTATSSGLIGNSARILIPTLNGVSTATAYAGLQNGIIGGWAVIGRDDWATYVPGLGVTQMGEVGAPQYTNLTSTISTINNASAVDNISLNAAVSGNIVNVTNDTTLNSLKIGDVTAMTVAIAATKTLTLSSGGLLVYSTAAQTIGSTVNQGNLTTSGSELFVYTQGAGVQLINSRITGSGVALVKFGANTLSLAGTNTYAGGTFVNQGTLTVAATGIIPLATVAANGLVISGSTVTLNAAGSINAGNIVTLNGGGSTLNLYGNNTLAGLVFDNSGGGVSNLAINTFSTTSATGAGSTGVLTIGASGIVATASNVASAAIIQGRVDFGSTAKTVNVDAIKGTTGVAISALVPALQLQGIVGSAGGLNKTGNGILQFNAQAHYAGATTVNAGGLKLGVTNAGSRNSALTLNGDTTSLNMNGLATTWGSLAGSGRVFNNSTTAATLTVGYDNSSTIFSGQIMRFNDAQINGVALTKIGTGMMTMSSAQSSATGSTGAITVSGGTLKYVDLGEAFNGSALSLTTTVNLNNGSTIALDNSGTNNVNSRLGLDVIGAFNLQGGSLTLNGASSAATTETITTFNVLNGGGRIELTPNASQPLTFAITTLNIANGTGSAVFAGIDGTASANGKANLTIATPNLLVTQGAGANGTTTMSVRHDILGDASASGLGTGFLVKDSATNNYRALAAGELNSTASTWAGTQNAGLSGTVTIAGATAANSITASGTTTFGSGLNATAFGSYGPNGGLLTQSLSNAAATLVLDGATATINVGSWTTTTAGTTPFFHVVGTGVLNMASALGIGGTAGLVKADDGTMNLNNRAYYTGTTVVNGGTLNLNSGAANTLSVIPTAANATVGGLTINGVSAIVDLKNNDQAVGALSSNNGLPGMGGTLTNSGANTVTFTTVGTGTFGGVISSSINLVRAGNSTTTLTNANTYTGSTTVRGGNLQLRDSGSISSTAGLNLFYGTLNWDNFGLNPTANPTRIAATNAVTLRGATITINGAGSTDTTVTLNSVTVAGGGNNINTFPYAAEAGNVTLTIGNLIRTTASKSGVNFNGWSNNNSTAGFNSLGAQGFNFSNIFLTQLNTASVTLTNNLIGGWAVTNGSSFATYNTTFGVMDLGMTSGGFTSPAYTGTDVSATMASTGNYNDGATTRSIPVAANAAYSWRFAPTAAQTITFPAGATLALGVGIIHNAAFTTTLAATNAGNTISGPAGGDLYFYVNQSAGTMTIKPAIIGTSSIILNGPQTLSLAPQFASNTYSGGTYVNGGTLNLNATATFTAVPGNLFVTNAAVTMSSTVANQIASTAAVTINGGGSVTFPNYSSGPTQTLASLTFLNEGGAAAPTFALGTPTVAVSTVILSSATPITSTNNSYAFTPIVSGSQTLTALQFSDANPVLTVNSGLAETGLTISAPITQHANMLTLTKTGNGALALSGTSTFTTGFVLNQGSLIFGRDTVGTPPSITSGPVGTATLTINDGTSVLSDGTVRAIGNAVTVAGNFTFGGLVAGNNVTFSGAMNLGAAARTITVTSPAVTAIVSGVVTSSISSGTALTKAGAGVLTLSAVSSLNGGAVAVTGGILKFGIAGAIPTASAITISAGAGLDLNGFNLNTVTQSVTSSGFITNSAASTSTITVAGTGSTDVTTVGDVSLGLALADNYLANALSKLGVTKGGLGTLTFTNTSSVNSGNILIVAGAVTGNADNTFSPKATVVLGNASTATAATPTATLDALSYNQTIGGITAGTTTNVASAVVRIGSGKTLTTTGTNTFGSDTSLADVTNVNFTDGGTFVANGALFQVGAASGGTFNTAVTVDMTALSAFTVNAGSAGIFRLGDVAATNGATSIVKLAPTSTITANLIGIGDISTGSLQQTLRLGSITNTLNANTITLGSGPASGSRGSGTLNFNSGSGELTIRGLAAGTTRANLNLVSSSMATGATLSGSFDVTGHTADLRFDVMTLASRTNTNVGTTTATFSFDTGELDANDLLLGAKASTGTATSTATMTLGGTTATATATFNSITNPLRIGQNTGTTSTATGTLNISGSAVTVAANGTTAIKLGEASGAGGTAAGTLNLTGGSLTVAGNIIRGAVVGTSTAVLNLDGGILDMGGFKIGGPSSTVGNLTTTTFASGTLSNVADINFGAGLTKTTAGTLTLTGNNTFGGGVTIASSGGIVIAGSNSALGTGTVTLGGQDSTLELADGITITNSMTVSAVGNPKNLKLQSGATSATYSGNITNNEDVSANFHLSASVGGTLTISGNISSGHALAGIEKIGAGTVILSGANAYTGSTTVSVGVLTAAHATALGTSAGATSVISGAELRLQGGIAIGAEALTLNGTGISSAGALRNISGDNSLGGAITLATASSITSAAGTLTLTGGVSSTDQNLTIGGAGNVTISTLALNLGTGTLTMNGSGTLLLSVANTFAGATINSGTVQIGNAGSLSGTITLVSGATLDLNGFAVSNTIVLAEGATLTGGSITASTAPTIGTVNTVLAGIGATLAKTDSGRLELTGANTYTGATSVSNGTIAVDSLGDGGGTSPIGTTTLSEPANLVISGGATLEFTGAAGAVTSRSFTLTDSAVIATGAGAGALNFTTNSTIDLTGNNSALRLTANNAPGNINIFRSEPLAGDTADGRAIDTLTVDGVGQWVIGGTANRFKNSTTFSISAGTTLGFESGSIGYSASSLINVGDNTVLRWSGVNTDDISGRLRIDTGDTAKLDIGSNNVVFASAPKDDAGAAITSGIIEKQGAGTLQVTFSSPNLEFNVPTGKLTVNGTVGNVNLTSSGTILGGDGTVGNVIMANGAEISPGNSPGTLNMASLTVAASNIINWQVQDALAPGIYDQIHITGSLDLNAIDSSNKRIVIKVASLVGDVNDAGYGVDQGAPLNFDNADTPGAPRRTFDFMRVDGAIDYNDGFSINIADYFTFVLTDFEYTNGGSNNLGLWSISSEVRSGDTYIMITAVPEPSTYGFALGALALAAAAIRRRRKNQAAKAEASGS